MNPFFKHYSLTCIAGLIVVPIVLWAEVVNSRTPDGVSWETNYLMQYRDEFHVRAGVTRDGLASVTPVNESPFVASRLRYPNHNRTLRVYMFKQENEKNELYLESAHPFHVYKVDGRFTLPDSPHIFWSGRAVLDFSCVTERKVAATCILDVSDGSFRFETATQA